MKHILRVLTLVGLAASTLAGYAQTTPPTTDAPASPASITSTNDAAPPGTTAAAEQAAPAADTNAVASASVDTNAPVATSASTPADTNAVASASTGTTGETNSPAADSVGAAPIPASMVDSAVPETNAIIPLIVMDDVPLTDAIRNLARQAKLNYMLDPKIGYGQVGPDGKSVTAQPMVSIRWENVTAQQALYALLNNYNLDMLTDPKTKIARVTIKDPAAPPQLMTKIIQLQYSSPSNLLDSIKGTLTDKRSKVVPDVRTSQLVLLATEPELIAIDQLVARLDTPTKQVLIEAHLIETSMNPSTIKGLDWSGTLEHQQLDFGNNLRQAPSSESINRPLATKAPKLMIDTAKGFNPATAFLDADGVSAVFSFLNKYAQAKVLSAPRTVTLDNEPATISVSRASPIINVTPGTANTTGGSQILYTNLGVSLNVTPRISANNFVNLKVTPEVSRIFDTVRKVVADGIYEADEYDIRKLDTRVIIPSGNTLVLGGLVQDDVREGNTKVPILGDIPGLGFFFRSDSKSRQKSNLLIFITPTIVQDTDYQPRKTEFLKSTPPAKDSIEEDWSAWDSGKPRDWGKKKDAEAKGDVAGKYAPVP